MIKWIYLKEKSNRANFSDYINFIDQNPNYPRINRLRYLAEHKLSTEKISPNKTLEGLIGGLLASLFFSIFLIYIAEAHYWIGVYLLLGGLFAFFGDLLISYFKRKSGIKDTGSILPGHGGVLDRIDSHLIATPLLIILVLFS